MSEKRGSCAKRGENVLDRLLDRPADRRGRTLLPARAATPLHVMPTSVGREYRDDAAYDHHGLRRGDTAYGLIQLGLSGVGRLTYEHRDLLVPPGHAMVLTFPHAHRYRTLPGDRWHFAWVCLTGREALRLLAVVIHRRGPVLRLGPDRLARLADALDALLDHPDPPPALASALGYHALAALIDDLASPPPGPGRDADTPAPFDAVTRHIARHPDADLAVPALADMAGMSRSHFSRVFAHHLGRSPAAYVLEQRMRLAGRLLHTTRMSIKQIAARVGYADPAYFAKAFARYHHMTPTAFRHSGMYVTEPLP
jgi:AraC-like DNA-binding protein